GIGAGASGGVAASGGASSAGAGGTLGNAGNSSAGTGNAGTAGADACAAPPDTGPLATVTVGSEVPYGTSSYGYTVNSGDFNNDCIPDLVVPFGTLTRVAILLGKGDGSFGPAIEGAMDTGATYPIDVATGDFDRDGNLDIVLTGTSFGGAS